jgi:D-arabinose 1-dehydrogenase-like Zn-dependent alcohol dehydrogenase
LAYRYHPGGKKLFEEQVERPKPGPNDAILKVSAAGVCHSDLPVLDGEVPFLKSVFTMGHEVCGELVETGDEVPDTFTKGALYAVLGPNPCGNCAYCRTGRDNLCDGPGRAYIGLGADGGYGELLKVSARNILEVPDGVSAVGLGALQVPFLPMVVASNEIRVQGSFWGTSMELREVLRSIADGRIKPQVEAGTLGDVSHWIDELRQGRVKSRIALLPKAA